MVGSPEPAPNKAAELLDQLTLQVERTVRASGHAQVHHLRVAIRRFRQALTVFEEGAGLPGIRSIHRKLKKTMALAGAVRDCDITVKLVRQVNAPASLLAKLQRRREQARRVLVSALCQWRDGKLGLKWRITLAGLSGGAPARQVLLKATRRLFKRARKIKRSTKAMHRLRIAAKKLRYTMEVAGDAERTRLHQIKKLQKYLGIINDYAAALRIMDEEAAAKRISTHLKGEQRKEIRVFRHHWNQVFAGKENEWIEGLAHAHK